MSFDLKKKGLGFYAACLAAILCLVTAIYYQMSYSGNSPYSRYYSAWVFYPLVAALPVAVVFFLLKWDNFVPAVLTALSGISILQFVHSIYWYISVVLVGIDEKTFAPEFIACCVLLVVTFVIAEISIYLRMKKKAK